MEKAGMNMERSWSEKQSRTLMGKWFGYKSQDYRLLFIKASDEEGSVRLEYMLEKNGYIESVDISIPENSAIPSVTAVFPEGAQMQKEIADTYPVRFISNEDEINPDEEQNDLLTVEWGPFHPLLQEPVFFRFLTRDDAVNKAYIETGYNYRGVEPLCIGEKIPHVLDMLERISSVNGFSIGLAFLRAVEKVNMIVIPDRAKYLRLILREMSFLRANLFSLSHITQCLGLLSDNSDIFKLISLYNEAASLITGDPQLKGILVPGGIKSDIEPETLFQANAVLQETVQELTAIRNRWNSTGAITGRMSAIGKIDKDIARVMTGRAARSAGFPEDTRKLSDLPYHVLSYKVPVAGESNCFTRTMLMFEDSLLSISLIDQAIEIIPRGDVKAYNGTRNKGEAIIREPEAFGELILSVGLEGNIVTDIKIRNSSSLNFSFLNSFLAGTELNELPLLISSLDLDLSGMEK